jgi:hypothetical protein
MADTAVALRVPAMVGGNRDSPDSATALTDAQRHVLHHAGIVESGSEHPLGRPILAAAEGLCDLPTHTHSAAAPVEGCARPLRASSSVSAARS